MEGEDKNRVRANRPRPGKNAHIHTLTEMEQKPEIATEAMSGCGYRSADDWPMPLRDYEAEERRAKKAAQPPPQQISPPPSSGGAAREDAPDNDDDDREREEDESTRWSASFFGDDVGNLQLTLDAKTDEFNALRQRLLRPVVVYDGSVLGAQRTFETLKRQIDRLKALKLKMTGGRAATYDQAAIDALVDGVLQRNNALLSPPPGPPPEKRAKTSADGESAEQRERRLRLKNVSDKDKHVRLLPMRAFGPRAADRRIKHTRAADERTVRDVVRSAVGAAAFAPPAAPSPDGGQPATITLEDGGAADAAAADAREGDVACAACGGACRVDERGWRFVCDRCGMVQERTLTDADAGGATLVPTRYGASTRRPKGSSYKTLGHFTEIMYQLQGKRKAKAPREVREECRSFCVRNGVRRNDIDEGVVRKCLRKYRHGGQYYKYAMEIACELRGVPLPCMTELQETILTHLYPLAVHAYHSSPRYIKRMNNRVGRIKDRPNNMIGNYVLYKLCELCGFDDFLPYIRLSKNVDNVRENDESWKHVCGINRWKFYTTKFYSCRRAFNASFKNERSVSLATRNLASL